MLVCIPHTIAVCGSYALTGSPVTRLDVGLTICRRFVASGIRRLNRSACYGAATPCGGRRQHIIPYLGVEQLIDFVKIAVQAYMKAQVSVIYAENL